MTVPGRSISALLLVATLAAGLSCRPTATCTGDDCGTLVIASAGTPESLLPPVTDAILDRDIHDQLFLKLADIGDAGNTTGDAGFVPQLADRWTWPDSLTLQLHLDPRAHWHDGRPVTAADVAFTFDAFTDTAVNSPYAASLARIASVTARDSTTAEVRFRARYAEMFYDATYFMRILPRHLLDSVPRVRWRTAAFGRAPVGSGPYRFVNWQPGQSVELVADTTFFLGRPGLRRLVWRFTPDLPVAVTQLVAGEADAIEVLPSPALVAQAQAATHLTLYPYPGSAYTVLAFNLRSRSDSTRPHPVLGSAAVRRALALATDRAAMMANVHGAHARLPAAPLPQAWTTLWFADRAPPPFDTARARTALDAAGWRTRSADGVRVRDGQRLQFAIAVPATSAARKQFARLLQEQLRVAGVGVTLEEMDPPTLQARLRTGDFDAAIETWVNDPTPSSGVPQAWRHDGPTNFGHYASAPFEAALARAVAASDPVRASAAWHDAFDVLANDAPALVLAAPDNIAAVDGRVVGVRLRADSYWAHLWRWRIPPEKRIDRDRVGR